MEFLKLLESFRTPVLDSFFSAITYFGDEVLILGIAFIILWALDKRLGFGIIYSLMLGVVLTQFLKGIFRIPRPWVRDPSFTIVEDARKAATGYSFPSGHTLNSTVLFGCVAGSVKSKAAKALLILLIILVGFSRMYLGVHTPADVVTSWVLGGLMVLCVFPLLNRTESGRLSGFLPDILFFALSVALVVFSAVSAAGAGGSDEVARHGVENACSILGLAVAFPLVRYIDMKKLDYRTDAVLWAQVLKCLFGIALVFVLRMGLKPALAALIGNQYVATAIRYFILAFFGGTVWPLTFRFWSRLGRSGNRAA
jgi:membrane-associated phospholipid phosphatase